MYSQSNEKEAEREIHAQAHGVNKKKTGQTEEWQREVRI